ncbi:hypothetical protein AB0M68_40350 [Streptomyces sp. NPDC051453]|uniref:hypothetical protein n=1 Tax=Streptomyces sp. NPDC051453 TaxID=3154941 RepID=UPI00343C331E
MPASEFALIDDIADDREGGAGRMRAADAVLRGGVWVLYVALGVLLVVLGSGAVG